MVHDKVYNSSSFVDEHPYVLSTANLSPYLPNAPTRVSCACKSLLRPSPDYAEVLKLPS